jgi:hypothetical protein
MQLLNYIKNKIMLPKKLNEAKLVRIISDLASEIKALRADGFTMPLSKRQSESKKPMPTYLIAFFFSEKDIEVLQKIRFGDKIQCYQISDHEAAEVAREFCRSKAAKIAVRVLPYLPWFTIDHLSIFFHYDPCLPKIEFTRRIYTVSIYMDKLKSLRMKDLNEDNIRN